MKEDSRGSDTRSMTTKSYSDKSGGKRFEEWKPRTSQDSKSLRKNYEREPEINASQEESWPYEDRLLGIAASGAICIISTAAIPAVIGSVVDLINESGEAS